MASLRILCTFNLPDGPRYLWDGSGGPFVDGDGNIYRPAQFTDDALQSIEAAINGEAFTLTLSLIGIDAATGDEIWDYDDEVGVVGASFVLKIQELDDYDQPVGEPEIKFTGTIDNLDATDQSQDEAATSMVTIDIVNAFTLRTTTSGSVLSDVDQRARAALLNPSAPPDRACERIPGLRDKTIAWPNWK